MDLLSVMPFFCHYQTVSERAVKSVSVTLQYLEVSAMGAFLEVAAAYE